MGVSYKQESDIRPVRLTREDLIELEALVRQGFPLSNRKEDFEIGAYLPQANVSFSSVKEFLEQKDLPKQFASLNVRMIGWGEPREINKSVDLTMFRNFVTLNVSGTDQTWVLGKFQQIRRFLEEHSPWYWRLSWAYPYATSAVIVLVALTFSSLLRTNIIYAATTGIFGVTWILGLIAYLRGTFLVHVKIILVPTGSFLTKENLILIVELATLLVTIVGSILRP
jgi:hypothetical protein